MRRKAGLVFWLFWGTFATIGGWWALLSMFNLAPEFLKDYNFLNFILAMTSFTTLLTALAVGGPYLYWDAIKSYKEGSTIVKILNGDEAVTLPGPPSRLTDVDDRGDDT